MKKAASTVAGKVADEADKTEPGKSIDYDEVGFNEGYFLYNI